MEDMWRSHVLIYFGGGNWAKQLRQAGANPTQEFRRGSIIAWCNDQGLTLHAAPADIPFLEAFCEGAKVAVWGESDVALPAHWFDARGQNSLPRALAWFE